jgi:hypothetical protein
VGPVTKWSRHDCWQPRWPAAGSSAIHEVTCDNNRTRRRSARLITCSIMSRTKPAPVRRRVVAPPPEPEADAGSGDEEVVLLDEDEEEAAGTCMQL